MLLSEVGRPIYLRFFFLFEGKVTQKEVPSNKWAWKCVTMDLLGN